MKKIKIFFALCVALALAASCQKVDLSQIESRLNSIDNRVTTLEGAVAALEKAVKDKLVIDKYEKTSKGYVLKFTNGESIELLNGEKGETGATGAQGKKGDKGDKGDTGDTGAQGEKGDKGDKGDSGKDGDSFLQSITEEDGFVVIVLNDATSTTYRLPMANVIKIGDDEDVIEVPYQKNDTIALTISPLKDIACISATILAKDGSTTDVKTKTLTAACGWQVEVTADTNVVVFCDKKGDKALLQVSVVKKDGTTYTASKPLENEHFTDVSIAEFNAHSVSDSLYRLKCYVAFADNAAAGDFHVFDSTGKCYVYNCSGVDKSIKAGDEITIIGKRGERDKEVTMIAGKVESYKSIPATTMDEFNKKPDGFVCVLTGVVAEILNVTYGNIYLEDATGRGYLYGLVPNLDGTGGYKGLVTEKNIAVGDTLSVYGKKKEYKGQQQMPNAGYLGHKKKQGTFTFFKKEGSGATPVEAYPDKDGVYVVKSAQKEKETSPDWDSQCFFVLPKIVPDGTKFHVTFEYKASSEQNGIPTQLQGDPGIYLHWNALGSINFTTDWKTYDGDVVVSSECQNKFRSIGFNLSRNIAVDYYFRNIEITLP